MSHVIKILKASDLNGPVPRSFSYSRLSTYSQCSNMYRMQYIVRPDDVDTSSIWTVIGSRCHEALEAFYLSPESGQPGHYEHPYPALLDHWKRDLTRWKMPSAFDELQRMASEMSHLLLRCSANYRGPDAIRTKDGRVPSNPAMTGEYKKAIAAMQYDRRKSQIDQMAAAADDLWKTISLTDVFTETSTILFDYRHPELIRDVLFIEFPLSDKQVYAADPEGNLLKDDEGNIVTTSLRNGPYPAWVDPNTNRTVLDHILNPVFLPDGSLFQGYIDIVGRDHKGNILLGDHKTSKGEPTSLNVKRHQQLLMYAWAWHQLTGTWPALIGINHLRTKSMTAQAVIPELAEKAVHHKMQIVECIDKEAFVQMDPWGFGAACLDYRTGEPACAYFKHCHAEIWQEMEALKNPEDWDPFN